MPIIEEILETATIDSLHRHADNRRTPPRAAQNQKPVANSGAARKILFVFLKWNIMACILAVFLLFIGVAAVVVIYFFFANIAFRHNRRRPRPRPSDPAASIRDLLPSVRYSVSEQSTRDCSICLEGFKDGEACRKLPDCTHLFHAFCVDSWLVKKPNCPVCRTAVPLNRRPFEYVNDEDWRFWWHFSIGA